MRVLDGNTRTFLNIGARLGYRGRRGLLKIVSHLGIKGLQAALRLMKVQRRQLFQAALLIRFEATMNRIPTNVSDLRNLVVSDSLAFQDQYQRPASDHMMGVHL